MASFERDSDFTFKLSEHSPSSIRFGEAVESQKDLETLRSFDSAERQIVSISVEGIEADLDPLITFFIPDSQKPNPVESVNSCNIVVEDFMLPSSVTSRIIVDYLRKPGPYTLLVSPEEQ